MPYTQINGAKIFYTDQGSGAPLVLTHGLGSDHTMWALQLPEFNKHYRVITWDVRGHGRSEVTDEGYSLAQFVDDLSGLLGYLGIEKAHIGGLSMGGWISWSFALAHPEMTCSLVLSNAAGLQTGIPEEQFDQGRKMMATSADIAEKDGRGGILLEATIKLMFCEDFIQANPEMIELVRERLKGSSGVGFARTVRGIFQNNKYGDDPAIVQGLAGILVPALVLAGDKDVLTPLSTQVGLSEAIPGSRLEVFENAGHVTNMEQPEKWNKLALDFLAAVSCSG